MSSERSLASFDAATAAKLDDEGKLKLTKKQLVEVANYNASRIFRLRKSRQELHVEIADLKVKLAEVDRDRAERHLEAAREDCYRQQLALSRMEKPDV